MYILSVNDPLSVTQIIELMYFRTLIPVQYWNISITFCRVALPSRTTVSSEFISGMEKSEAKLLSVLVIPIPKSAYFIAIRSLAPSPHIPIFSGVLENKRVKYGLACQFSIFSLANL